MRTRSGVKAISLAARERLDVGGVHLHAVLVSDQVLQEDFDRVREAVDAERQQRVRSQ
jgi:hypothetical protein